MLEFEVSAIRRQRPFLPIADDPADTQIWSAAFALPSVCGSGNDTGSLSFGVASVSKVGVVAS